MPQEKLPFLEIFSPLAPQLSGVREVEGWLVCNVTVNPTTRTLQGELESLIVPDEALLARVERLLAQCYQLEKATLTVVQSTVQPQTTVADLDPPPWVVEEKTVAEPAPVVVETPAPPPVDDPFQRTEAIRAQALKEVRQSGSSKKKSGQNKVIYGKMPSKINPIPMNTLELDMGTVTVEGDVFYVEHKELKKRGAWVITFDITDYTSSIRVNKFMPGDEGKPIVEGVKKGQRLIIQGRLNINRFDNDMVLEPNHIIVGEKPKKEDLAEEKRVELHLHTKMSAMDGLTDVKSVVGRAIEWGHPAIAITDHGVVQSFPDAWSASKGKIKILYGVEAYYNNDVDDRVVVQGTCNAPLNTPIVCFDLETTGLSAKNDLITEIGAVVLENGEITQRFNTFADPQRPLSPEITNLTGITDEMLEGAPSQAEALEAFFAFADGRPLAAHNAEFDMGFLAEGCRRLGKKFEYTSIDTLILAQNLLPNLGKYKLDSVADHLNLPAFNHHRAEDDAATVGHMLIPFMEKLADMGVDNLSAINPAMSTLRTKGSARRQPRHLIVFAKDKIGLRNLYKLVSLAHLDHFKRYPIMLKSVINENREGLILGSACEAGELYSAVMKGKRWSELLRIASWYDFLEIQPLSNNAFMLRPDKNGRSLAQNEGEIMGWNRTIIELGQALNKPVCATGDVHFMDPEEEVHRHVLLSSKGFADADSPNPLYFRTTEEMLAEFSYLGEELAHQVVVEWPNQVAAMCEVIKPLPDGLFAPKLENSVEELNELVWGKVKELYGENPPQLVLDRTNAELGDIINCKYDVIYMSAQKLVQDSLEHGYLVGSRGSVGSSIVAYLSGITEVNSLPPHYRCGSCQHSDFETGKEYGCGADMPDAICPNCGAPYIKDGFNIPFETFLGFGGDKVPDIDLNFSGEYQSSAHKHTFALFGQTHVFRAGTIGTVAEKTAFGYVKKYLEAQGRTVTRAEENRLAQGCTGVKRTTGQHPGGMVVIPQDKEIYDFCPVQHPADDTGTDIITTHFEYHAMESNLLKLDMLGHDDPSMIRMLEDLTGVNARAIALDDPDTMSLFTSSEKLGFFNDKVLGPTGAVAIPEFGTSFVRGMLQDTSPTEFDTLVRLSGFSHGTDVWLGNARDLIVSGTATVGQAIGCRDDIMLYLISCGMDEKRAFKIMELVRKGKGLPEGAEEEMQNLNVPQWYIDSCKKIKYLFPKAHAVAYVMMAFRIAWFKVHRPLAFYAAYFSIRAKAFDATVMCHGLDGVKRKMAEITAKDKQATAVEQDMMTTLEVCYEFYIRGFSFAKMDIYHSDATRFGVDEDKGQLMPPFVAVPGLGETAAVNIVDGRVGKTFVSVEEFALTCPKVSKTHIEQLKLAGALGNLPDTSQMSLF